MKEIAVIALTPGGLELGRRIVQALGRGELVSAEGAAVRQKMTELFQAGRPLICIMALGIVVRILGPLARDKETDPPVVVVDEAGKFAISVLGGHVGGANELARELGQRLGALPVITTASETLGLPAMDLVGKLPGWTIEGKEYLKSLMAAVIHCKPVAYYQEPGLQDPIGIFENKAARFQRIHSWPEGEWAGVLVVTDRFWPKLTFPTVIFRPRSLVLGVGCRRGVPCAAIEQMFQHICQSRGFSPLSLGLVASATLKADEDGLLEFAQSHEAPLRFFSGEELAQVADLPTPSDIVLEKIGIPGVAEPAAMLAAGNRKLLLPKVIGDRITMAIARREDA